MRILVHLSKHLGSQPHSRSQAPMEATRASIYLALITLTACAMVLYQTWKAAASRRRQSCAARCENRHCGKVAELEIVKRLLMVTPFPLLAALPTLTILRSALSLSLCWLLPCKLLLLSFADFLLDSPSATDWVLSAFPCFLMTFLPPVRIREIDASAALHDVPSLDRLHHLLTTFILRLTILVFLLTFYGTSLLPSDLLHCVLLYLCIDLPHRLVSLIMLASPGISTYPAFDRPWLSHSLTNFWGQWWNLMANAVLRHTVYNPAVNFLTISSTMDYKKQAQRGEDFVSALKSASAPAPPALPEKEIFLRQRTDMKASQTLPFLASTLLLAPSTPPSLGVRLVGVNATFFVSGLMHELIYFCITQGETPTWEVTLFFLIQGVASSMEIIIRRRKSFGTSLSMPRALCVAFTMVFMYTTASRLFFPQLVRANVYTKCCEEYKLLMSYLFGIATEKAYQEI
ncbi:hypothetical protein KP509_06G042900 [Ceratopteris richardii]|uniref:Wax synthase domain-containing protein n=1 Tax=Ceratopteris richardii TaxID=49495 RepID=A0A8T2UFY4_CERRI|nr:hypothetical protein KP509_06G042900 [Ceratopteris richardii]